MEETMRGRVCFVTGSNRGIGRAMVEEFARGGADIIAHARAKTDAFEADMSGLAEKYGVSVTPVYFDMTDTEVMKAVFKELYKNKTRIDILINNAGVAHGGLFGMTPVSKIKEVFEINLFSLWS
jgi:3-oxoacyl-[acyl-carrier protein] reductase